MTTGNGNVKRGRCTSNGLFICSDRERDDDPTVTIKKKESYTRQFAAVEKGTTGWV
jgi:hypothetical protein